MWWWWLAQKESACYDGGTRNPYHISPEVPFIIKDARDNPHTGSSSISLSIQPLFTCEYDRPTDNGVADEGGTYVNAEKLRGSFGKEQQQHENIS